MQLRSPFLNIPSQLIQSVSSRIWDILKGYQLLTLTTAQGLQKVEKKKRQSQLKVLTRWLNMAHQTTQLMCIMVRHAWREKTADSPRSTSTTTEANWCLRLIVIDQKIPTERNRELPLFSKLSQGCLNHVFRLLLQALETIVCKQTSVYIAWMIHWIGSTQMC